MIERRKITTINKGLNDASDRISYIGGKERGGWTLTPQAAIYGIEHNGWTFFIEVGGKPMEVVIAVNGEGQKYLKLQTEAESPDKLLSFELPRLPTQRTHRLLRYATEALRTRRDRIRHRWHAS